MLNDKPTRTRRCSDLAQARVMLTVPAAGAKVADQVVFDALATSAWIVRFGGDCYAYGLLVHGLVDVVVEVHLDPHDWQALIPVVQGACGVITTRKLPRYAVAERFFELLKTEESDARVMAPGNRQGRISLITSRCFTIQSAGAASAMTCLRSNMKSSISSGSRVSRKLVAIRIARNETLRHGAHACFPWGAASYG
jgi:hypothetical protein